MKIQYAGHSAALITVGKEIIAIDPWLEGNPRCPKNLINPERIDLIVLTHGHSDHASDTPRLAKKYNCSVAATWELANIIGQQGVQKLLPMNKGGEIVVNGITIALTQALHSSSFDGPNGAIYAGEPCGVIISDGKHTVYHAGDTALFSDMRLIQEYYHPDVALLPIGDRFTMNPKQAAHAAQLIGCKIAIPIHYATFDLLSGSASEFSKACKQRGIEAVTLEPGAVYNLD